MSGFEFVFLLSFGATSLACARWCWRRFAGRSPAAPLAAAGPLAAGLCMLGYVVFWLLSRAEGLSAFLLYVTLALAILALLGHTMRIFPHRPLVYLALAPGLASLAMLAAPWAWLPLLIVDGLAVLVAGFDLCTLPKRRRFAAAREAGSIASLRKGHPVTLTIENHSPRRFFLWVKDGVPRELAPRPDEFRCRLPGRGRATLSYQIHASRRGAFHLTTVHLRVRSLLGLWVRMIDCPAASCVHVYPDMKQLAEYALLARTNRLSLLGVRRTRRIGLDNEFERLRDYTPDDNYKHIDWRSTARRRKLTVKDFQTNQSQRLIFMLDCGRMMTNEAAGLSLLDHALNAMLMLSYVALTHGDSVGLICFSDEIHGYVPPSGGMRQMNRLSHASFDRFPKLVESRYDQAFLYLATHCRKRSLVVLISNLIDEVNAHQVGQYLRSFVGKHLPLGVLLRDRRLFEAVDAPPDHDDALYRAAAAADILAWRHQVLTDFDTSGVLSLDVYPEDLTAPLVNSYLEIKARHLL
ncbi:MAG TPA: DUF58 domain-containing protein [Pirellulales bacterium]|nr:DUF58 domain-containing protein [Pirellulales bacterium]